MQFGSYFFSIIKQVYIYVLLIMGLATTMVYLMWGVYSLPVEKIRANVENSVAYINQLPSLYNILPIYGLNSDVFTDTLILNNASFWGSGDSFSDSLLVYRVNENGNQEVSLQLNLHRQQVDWVTLSSYAVFWHGYLIFLKPLLMFFDLWQIRYINLVLQIGLLAAILILMYKRLGVLYCAAFVITMMFFNPSVCWMCLEFDSVINMMLLAVLWVLWTHNSNSHHMFFVIGAVTILFDFLTFPLVTLGIPLIVYISLYERGFKNDVFCVIKNSLLWGAGYASMMFLKWLVATIFTNEDVIADGIAHIFHRMAGPTEGLLDLGDLTAWESIKKNVMIIVNNATVVWLGIFGLFVFISYLCGLVSVKKNLKIFVFLGISLMPFVWYSVVLNHSIVHYSWTYKILAVTIYAVLSAIVCCFSEVKNDEKL